MINVKNWPLELVLTHDKGALDKQKSLFYVMLAVTGFRLFKQNSEQKTASSIAYC